MKPLRLTLEAVGPYAGRHVVDFRTAIQSRLFGIYGPTGAGKSTLFSAMTFALFGDLAKEEQPPSSLRSGHADPTMRTKVEFIFEIHGRIYRVERSPEQKRPVLRGSGETQDAHKATLFDVTGLDIDFVGDDNPGKVIAEARVDAVNKEIVKLLGYGAPQFRQIVLLPQGRFEKFLAAGTAERLLILRDLFDVTLYRRLAERVKDQADLAENEIKRARQVANGRLQAEQFETWDGFKAGIETATTTLADFVLLAETTRGSLEAANKTYQIAAATDLHFKEHVDAERDFKDITAQDEATDALKSRIRRARTAQTLLDAEQVTKDAKTEAARQSALTKTAIEERQKAEETAQRAANALEILVTRKPKHDADKQTLKDLNDFAKRLANSADQKARASETRRQAEEHKELAQQANTRHDELVATLEKLLARIEVATKAALERAELATEKSQTEQHHQAAKHFEKCGARVEETKALLRKLETDSERAEASLTACRGACDAAANALLDDHAAHVASHLVDGAPCPACGSTNHPAPAHGSTGAESLAEAYEEAKTALDGATTVAADARTKLSATREQVTEQEQEWKALSPPLKDAKTLEGELSTIAGKLKALGPAIDREALEKDRSKLTSDIAAALSACQTQTDQAQKSETAAALAQQSLEDALRSIPFDDRDAVALEQKTAALQSAITRFDDDLIEAEKSEREATNAKLVATTAASSAADAEKQANSFADKAQAHFNQRLATAGLSIREFLAAKLDVTSIAAIEAAVHEHQDKRSRADERLQRAARAIADTDRPDIKALKDAKDEAEHAWESANEMKSDADARLRHLQKLEAELAAEFKRLDKLESDTGPVRELADAFNGHNPQKMQLEVFAIGAMFDQVLAAANQRLGPMTRGRYTLVREMEGKGNAKRGLGLAVDDIHTGQTRPTSTLSGGETFIAALALALGLSDVVESTHGNVRLDTIFIDEGFGSLDAESEAGTLETVLDSLQEVVAQNRAVGLISHVALVQQAVPNGFWITKSTSGSTIEMRV
jgi:exonuclease SbcC